MKKYIKKCLVAGIICVLLFSFVSLTTAQSRDYLSHKKSQKGLQACLSMAEKNKWSMSIVVIDRGEDVVASARMDGALPASYKGASLKANTSLSWALPTGKVNEIMNKAPFFKQFPGILGIPGGEPVFSGKTLVGGVGVAGSSPSNDAKCAASAANAMK